MDTTMVETSKIDYDQDKKIRQREQSRQYRLKNKEQCNLKKKEYYDNNQERCQEASRLRGIIYRADNKEKTKEKGKRYRENKKLKLLLKNQENDSIETQILNSNQYYTVTIRYNTQTLRPIQSTRITPKLTFFWPSTNLLQKYRKYS